MLSSCSPCVKVFGSGNLLVSIFLMGIRRMMVELLKHVLGKPYICLPYVTT